MKVLWHIWIKAHNCNFLYSRMLSVWAVAQLTRVLIQSSATFIEHIYCKLFVEKTKIKKKRGRDWPI